MFARRSMAAVPAEAPAHRGTPPPPPARTLTVLCCGGHADLSRRLPFELFPMSAIPMISRWPVDAAATTARKQRSTGLRAGGRTPPVRTASPGAPPPSRTSRPYVDFPDRRGRHRPSTWAVRQRRHQPRRRSTARTGRPPGGRVAVWHGDTSAIHVLLVAVEPLQAEAVGLGARAGCARSPTSSAHPPGPCWSATPRGTPGEHHWSPGRCAVFIDESGDLRIDTAPGRARRPRTSPLGPRTTRS